MDAPAARPTPDPADGADDAGDADAVDADAVGEVDALVDAGFDALHDGDPHEALAISRVLARAGHAIGIELRALALSELDRVDEAIAVLRRSVEQTPGRWVHRQLLGNFLADSARIDDALAEFDRAEECPDADTDAIRMSRSVALWRGGRDFEALQAAESITAPQWWLRAGTQRARLLIEVERYAEALALAQSLRDELTERLSRADTDDGDGPLGVEASQPGFLLATLAVARLRATGDRDVAMRDARAAIEYDPANEGALWAWRHVQARPDGAAHGHGVIVHGRGTAPDGTPAEFLQRFEVMAESPDAALEFIRELEADEAVRDSISLDSYEPVDDLGDGLAGVFYASEREWYEPGE